MANGMMSRCDEGSTEEQICHPTDELVCPLFSGCYPACLGPSQVVSDELGKDIVSNGVVLLQCTKKKRSHWCPNKRHRQSSEVRTRRVQEGKQCAETVGKKYFSRVQGQIRKCTQDVEEGETGTVYSVWSTRRPWLRDLTNGPAFAQLTQAWGVSA
jgi:hypothetical protein